MATAPASPTFTVSQRLLRGYGPLAVFAVLLLLMSLLVPSKSPTKVNAAGAGSDTGGDVGIVGGEAGAAGAPGSAAGAAGGTAGAAGGAAGASKPGADAETVKAHGAFADMSAVSEPYADALAKRGIVGFGDPYLSQSWHVQHAPYIWRLASDGTFVAKMAAEYAGKRLCNKPAKWAGDDGNGKSMATKPRNIATFAPENSWYQESVQLAVQVGKEYACL